MGHVSASGKDWNEIINTHDTNPAPVRPINGPIVQAVDCAAGLTLRNRCVPSQLEHMITGGNGCAAAARVGGKGSL